MFRAPGKLDNDGCNEERRDCQYYLESFISHIERQVERRLTRYKTEDTEAMSTVRRSSPRSSFAATIATMSAQVSESITANLHIAPLFSLFC